MPGSSRSLVVAIALALAAACHAPAPPPAPPPSPPAEPAPKPFDSADLDALVRAAWAKAGVTPGPRADDATFLRRAWIDLAGVVPPPADVVAFVDDPSPDKRARLVDALLASPRFAGRMTDRWQDLLLGANAQGNVDEVAFRAWLRRRFAANEPWDRLVRDLVTASGTNSPGGAKNPVDRELSASEEEAPGVNGAVNWLLRYQGRPGDLAGAASRVFLGVQIQCAECHDHKSEPWKQSDFRALAACFARTRAVPADRDRVKGMLERFDVRDDANGPKAKKGQDPVALFEIAVTEPRALDHTPIAEDPTRRASLAAWLTSPQNPWFSASMVNRTWASLLGRGFVEPVDDVRSSSPALAPEVHRALTDAFVASGFDLRALVRTIALSEAYALAATPAGAKEGALWSTFRLEPMEASVLLDSLVAVTGVEGALAKLGADRERILIRLRRAFRFTFDVDEDDEDDTFQGTIAQALLLLDGALVAGGTSAVPGTALAELRAKKLVVKETIEALYLRTLARRPDAEELARWTAFVAEGRRAPGEDAAPAKREAESGAKGTKGEKGQAKGGGAKKKGRGPDPLDRLRNRLERDPAGPEARALEDVFWALVVSSEFFFNH
jgi:hypothetical protein